MAPPFARVALVAYLVNCRPSLGDRGGGRPAARAAAGLDGGPALRLAGAEAFAGGFTGAEALGSGLVEAGGRAQGAAEAEALDAGAVRGNSGRNEGTAAGHLANPINKDRSEPRKVAAAEVDFAVTPEEAINFVRVLGGEGRLIAALDNLTLKGHEVRRESVDGLSAKEEFLKLSKEVAAAKKDIDAGDSEGSELPFLRIGTFIENHINDTEFMEWILSEEGKGAVLRNTGAAEWGLDRDEAKLNFTDPVTDLSMSLVPQHRDNDGAKKIISVVSAVILSCKKFKVACEGEKTVAEIEFFKGKIPGNRSVLQARRSGDHSALYRNLQPWFQRGHERAEDLAFFARTDREVWSYEDELEAPLLGWRSKSAGSDSRELPNASSFILSTTGAFPILKILSVYFGADGIYHLRHKCVGALTIEMLKWIMERGIPEDPLSEV